MAPLPHIEAAKALCLKNGLHPETFLLLIHSNLTWLEHHTSRLGSDPPPPGLDVLATILEPEPQDDLSDIPDEKSARKKARRAKHTSQPEQQQAEQDSHSFEEAAAAFVKSTTHNTLFWQTLPIFFASVLLSLFPGFGASVQIRSRLHQEECRVQGMSPQPQLCQHHGLIHSNQPATCSADQSFVHGPRASEMMWWLESAWSTCGSTASSSKCLGNMRQWNGAWKWHRKHSSSASLSPSCLIAAHKTKISIVVSPLDCGTRGQHVTPCNPIVTRGWWQLTSQSLLPTVGWLYPLRSARTRANPRKPAQTRANPREPAQTRANPRKPARTRANPRKPARTRANPRKPAQTRAVKLGHNSRYTGALRIKILIQSILQRKESVRTLNKRSKHLLNYYQNNQTIKLFEKTKPIELLKQKNCRSNFQNMRLEQAKWRLSY